MYSHTLSIKYLFLWAWDLQKQLYVCTFEGSSLNFLNALYVFHKCMQEARKAPNTAIEYPDHVEQF